MKKSCSRTGRIDWNNFLKKIKQIFKTNNLLKDGRIIPLTGAGVVPNVGNSTDSSATDLFGGNNFPSLTKLEDDALDKMTSLTNCPLIPHFPIILPLYISILIEYINSLICCGNSENKGAVATHHVTLL